MFLRKLTVICVPLIMLLALCLLFPLLNVLDYFTAGVLRGSVLGVCLALLLPLAGAIKRREPFGGLLWLPAILTIALIGYQLVALTTTPIPVLSLLATTDGQIVQLESTFAAYMLTTCIRTSVR